MKNKTEVWKKASQVYAEISELSPQKALAHVNGIKNIAQDVRHAIITLISAGSQASQFYRDEIASSFHLGLDASQNFTAGQQLDEYELLEEIGHGGMSQVFKAKRINAEQQTHVAIKIFAPKDNNNELLNHFLNEQKVLAGLSHLNIVKMFHSGKTDDNVTYLVMELIAGAQSLDTYCQQNKLSIKQKIKYIAQCAQALSYSHANLIIHRDLKPDNILINQNKELKIVDFGIAKLINNDLSGNKTTIMALTPSYAAPEQINSGSITIKTDIFSLAVVALDLLCKDKPLPPDRLIKSCANDEQHLDALFKSLKIDKDLKNILNKALEQEPDKRYSSMQSFADDLNNYFENKPVNATSQSLIYRIQKFAKRRSALFATMVSFMVFLLVGSILGYQQYKQIKIENQKSQEVKTFLIDIFSYADPDQKIGENLSAIDLLVKAEDEMKYKSFSDDKIKSDILSNIGIAFVNLGSYDKGESNLLNSLQLDKNNIAAKLKLAQLYQEKSNQKSAQIYIDSAQKTIERNKNDYKNETGKLTLLKATQTTFGSDKEKSKGMKLAREARSIFLNLNDFNSILSSTRVLTGYQFNYSHSKEAIALSESTINLVERKVSSINTELLRLKTSLAYYYDQLGDSLKAKTTIDQVIMPLQKTMGENHLSLIEALVQRSLINRNLGKIKEAIDDAEKCYIISVKSYGELSQGAIQSLSALLQLRFGTGDKIQAEKDLKKVVDLSQKFYGINSSTTINAEIELANYIAANGRIEEALDSIKSTRERIISNLNPNNINRFFSTNVYLKLQTLIAVDKSTIALAEENNQNAISKLGMNHPQTAYSFFILGSVYNAIQEYDKANNAYINILETFA